MCKPSVRSRIWLLPAATTYGCREIAPYCIGFKIVLSMIFGLYFLTQVSWKNKTSSGKISKRPASILKIITSFDSALKSA